MTDYHVRRRAAIRSGKYRSRSDIVIEMKSEKNHNIEHKFRKLSILGKGGFAKVYRVEDLDSGERFALKIVDKRGLGKKNREKLSTEIKIHSNLDHRYICKFIRFFEDKHYVYLLLELCDCDTLMELMASRKRLTEPETKYFMYQLILALVHMHKKRIIHRDMKLGNVFLDDQMDVKIGDYGLAAQLSFDGQRKRTLCGTPNYIAPEILMNAENGHSYEVDIWSLGVILFTLLTGKPPFETRTVKQTYRCIRHVDYSFPPNVDVSDEAKELIQDIFQKDPFKRPTIFEMLEYPLFNEYRPFPSSEILQLPRTLYNYVKKRTNRYPVFKKKRRMGSYMLNDDGEERSGGGNEGDHQLLSVPMDENINNNNGIDNYLKNRGCGSKPVPLSPHMKKMRRHQPLKKKKREEEASQKKKKNRHQHQHRLPISGNKENNKRRTNDGNNNNNKGYEHWLYRKLEKSFQDAMDGGKKVRKVKKKDIKVQIRQHQLEQQEREHQQKRRAFQVYKRKRNNIIGREQVTKATTTTTTTANKEYKVIKPKIWVENIADYSKKYGLAYRYNTGIVGSFFNDYTMMLYNPSRGTVKYFIRSDEDEEGEGEDSNNNKKKRKTFQKESYTIVKFPEHLKKKMTLIKYFHHHFNKTSGSMIVLDEEDLDSTEQEDDENFGGDDYKDIFVKMYLKTKDANVFRLSNRIVQVIFTDKSEIVLSSEAKMVTYVSKYGTRKTYALEEILEGDPDPSISKRLKYTKNILFKLIKK